MTKTPAPNRVDYETDFFAWTEEQARLLRARALDAIDAQNLAEEIESLGRRDRRELMSRLAVLIAHLLKWQLQPDARSRSWEGTIGEQRQQIVDIVTDSPSLRRAMADRLASTYERAKKQARTETGLAIEQFPMACPYALDEILAPDFLPAETAPSK